MPEAGAAPRERPALLEILLAETAVDPRESFCANLSAVLRILDADAHALTLTIDR